ncbi:serine--tRNA ligase [Christensenellaceae bacterium OttesenSCG-928-L17]|nr:serine--tRNA ligase [Christensenellaceae bacterium OttesenSCG-928-L17]
MLDINYIRANKQKVIDATQNKALDPSLVDQVLTLDDTRRDLLQKVDALRAERNQNAEAMKSTGGQPDQALIDRGKQIKVELAKFEPQLEAAEDDYLKILKQIPNVPLDGVPVGLSEEENVVVEIIGEPTKFDFEPKNHYEIAMERGWLDKERAAKVAGARFAYIMGDMVKLQFAIVNFVIDTLTDEQKIKEIADKAGLEGISTKPFIPVLPPYMIKTSLYDAMDRLEPRDDRYKIEGDDLWLQGSAEHVLGSMHQGEIFSETDLPLRYLGYATSFRQEAGTYGKDMEGIIRMHQFDKLEMESFTTAEDGLREHYLFVAFQRYFLDQLELPYQVLEKCTYDIGKPNARGIDMEVFLPGQAKYRETHTADYMTDYQARRLKTRVRRQDNSLELVHTNDATAFALGRIMIAIIENYQTAEGKITIPDCLRPYLHDRETL